MTAPERLGDRREASIVTYEEIRKLFLILVEWQDLDPNLADMVLHNVVERLRGWRFEGATPERDKAGEPS